MIETITGAECWMCGESNKDAVDYDGEIRRAQVCFDCILTMYDFVPGDYSRILMATDAINEEIKAGGTTNE